MIVHSVDERDGVWERTPREFRVLTFAKSDGLVRAYDLDDCTPDEALEWSAEVCGDAADFALAIRLPEDDRGSGLIWLVPPPR